MSYQEKKKITYSVYTIWDWTEEQLKELQNLWGPCEEKYDSTITYIPEKQCFEFKQNTHEILDELRDALVNILLKKSVDAKPISMVPYRPKRRSKSPVDNGLVGLPPKHLESVDPNTPSVLDKIEDTDGLEDTFYISDNVRDVSDMLGRNQQFSQPCDYLKEICKDCDVNGNLNMENRTIHIIGRKRKDVNEAIERLKELERVYLRPSFKHQEIPLVHYPNQSVLFKLYFLPVRSHPWFKFIYNLKDAYIIIPANKNPVTQKWTLPKYVESEQSKSANNIAKSNTPSRGPPVTKSPQTESKYDWPEVPQVHAEVPWNDYGALNTSSNKDFPALSPSVTGSKSAASIASTPSLSPTRRESLVNTEKHISNSNSSPFDEPKPRLTEEEKLARKESKKQRIIDRRKQRAQNYGASTDNGSPISDVFPSMSNSSNWSTQDKSATVMDGKTWSDKVVGKKVDEKGGINVVMRNVVLEQNPNNSNASVNGNNMPNTFGKMLRDYNLTQISRVLSEGLEYVRSQREEVRLFGSLGKVLFTKVPPNVSNILWDFTDLKDVIIGEHGVCPLYRNHATTNENLYQSFVEVLGPKTCGRTSFFEINANARNSPYAGYTPVSMYVNCDFVSLDKVTIQWNHLVDIDWTVLDRNYDFGISLQSRRVLRSDVKPFTTFMKKVSVSPTNNMITYENVVDFLHVKSINYKQVSRYMLHEPFIAELTRTEQVPLSEQTTHKVLGKTGHGPYWYTIEVINDKHDKYLKSNETLGPGQMSKWTVDNIIGDEPKKVYLAEYVKAMLLLIERCHRYVEIHKKRDGMKRVQE